MLDVTGELVDAKVTWVRTIASGPAPGCGYLVQNDAPVRMQLDGPLLPADWTAEVNYLANSEGSLTMSLTTARDTTHPDTTHPDTTQPDTARPTASPETKVPVHPGLNRVFARLPGAGDAINVRANTAALSVCISPGPVGFVAPV
jgi:hypothetical protein